LEKPAALSRRTVLTHGLTLGASTLASTLAMPLRAQAPDPFNLRGRFIQSGYCIGQSAPNAELWVDGNRQGTASTDGWFYVGFDRDSPATSQIELRTSTGTATTKITIASQTYDTQRVDGLPPETVTPEAPETLERIKRDAALKAAAFASRDADDSFKSGFIWPLKNFIVSGRFGNQRILNGVPKSPHYGFDMAAPIGTPIYAPQGGLVVLAESDLFYEGGLTLIDHGQGVISMYLHQSRVLVKTGDRVVQGQLLGLVGDRGRATGPHLCWRLKWGDRHMDPSLMVKV
jgi:murein DD-endopeptidase MepM/ murein hydrolase activator NlpD